MQYLILAYGVVFVSVWWLGGWVGWGIELSSWGGVGVGLGFYPQLISSTRLSRLRGGAATLRPFLNADAPLLVCLPDVCVRGKGGTSARC